MPRALAAENLFPRKRLALFQERKVKPHRAHDSTRLAMVILGSMFSWRAALVNIKPHTVSPRTLAGPSCAITTVANTRLSQAWTVLREGYHVQR